MKLLEDKMSGMKPAETRNPVREVRLALRMTQEVMGSRLGCTKQTIRRCEAHASLPQTEAVVGRLRALAKEAGIELPE